MRIINLNSNECYPNSNDAGDETVMVSAADVRSRGSEESVGISTTFTYETDIKLTDVKTNNTSSKFTKEYMPPSDDELSRVVSSKEQFNNTVNMSSHQRLLEIEEKRKKRKDRKTQQHFRGSSFGQGSVPKTIQNINRTNSIADNSNAYEYGSNGFTLEESSEVIANEEFNQHGIDTLINKVNNFITEKATKSKNKNSHEHKNSEKDLLN